MQKTAWFCHADMMASTWVGKVDSPKSSASPHWPRQTGWFLGLLGKKNDGENDSWKGDL